MWQMGVQVGNLRQWQYFVALAETGSFTQAAIRLGVSQPPVSNAIKRLETVVGTPLFIRGSGEVRLTEAGLALLPYARVIGRDLKTIDSKVEDIRNGAKVGFRIALSSALPPEIGYRIALKAHQMRNVSVSTATSAEIIAQLEEGAIHAGIVQAPVPLGALRSAEQFSLSRDLVVSPKHSKLDRNLSELTLLIEHKDDNPDATNKLIRELYRSGISCESQDFQDVLASGVEVSQGKSMILTFRGFHNFENVINLPARFDFSVYAVVRRVGSIVGAEAMAKVERICRGAV